MYLLHMDLLSGFSVWQRDQYKRKLFSSGLSPGSVSPLQIAAVSLCNKEMQNWPSTPTKVLASSTQEPH